MGNPLRDRRPVADLAARGQVIEIADKIGSFDRLARIVEADLSALDPDKIPRGWRDAEVVGRLRFGFADAQQRVVVLEGSIEVTVDAVCQRCLEPLRLPLYAELRLLPTIPGQHVAAGAGFDVWELEDDSVRPADIVEEVLIMAMPLSATHDAADDCTGVTGLAQDETRTTRPFATLKARLDDNG